MKTSLFDFELPPERIALRPVSPRDSARLLVVQPDGGLAHLQMADLPGLLRPGDALCVNDSRVLEARLAGIRPARQGGAPVAVDITLLRRDGEGCFWAFAKPARRLRPEDRILFAGGLEAVVRVRNGPEILLAFNRTGEGLEASLRDVGEMPLPPYIARKRPPDVQDRTDYQTVYANRVGSVAAPTAGLHFTPELLDRLKGREVALVRTTLHVGAGTFLPVSSEDIEDHRMHSEWSCLSAAAAASLNAAHERGGRVAAVGTTSLRTLESAAAPDGTLAPFERETDIFITPGYRFRAVDVLLTNFHLPRSTLFMLVCAFMGTDIMQAAYAEAIREHYRFYSYGDACLLIRPS
jgi:S-adenosylmethionine:tRNA ribosyltransferase-isomerase